MSSRKTKSENQLTKVKEAFDKYGYVFMNVIPLEDSSYIEATTPYGVPVVVKTEDIQVSNPTYRPSTTKRISPSLEKIGKNSMQHLTGVAIQHPDTYYINDGITEQNYSPKSTSSDQYKTVRILPLITMKELEHDAATTTSNADKVFNYISTNIIKFMEDSMNNMNNLLSDNIRVTALDYFDTYDDTAADFVEGIRTARDEIKSNPDNTKHLQDKISNHTKAIDALAHQSYEVHTMNENINQMILKLNTMKRDLDSIRKTID